MKDHLDTSLLQLIAAAADGELSPEQASELERRMQQTPESRGAFEAELAGQRKLRAKVGRVMGTHGAPAGLQQQVRAAMAFAGAELDQQAPDIAGRIEDARQASQANRPRRRTFASPYRANALAIAATLALIVGAVLYGIFGRTIDDVVVPSVDLVSDAAEYVDRQHGDSAHQRRELERMSRERAEEFLAQHFGTSVNVFDLTESGYEFVAAEQGKVPVPAKSAHLLYRKMNVAGDRVPYLSVFILRDRGQCGGKLCDDIDRGTWCCVTERAKCKRKVLRGTDGKLVYFMTCCVPNDLESAAKRVQLASSTPSSR